MSPRPTFRPHADVGAARLAGTGALPIDFQLHLIPNVSAGQYTIDTEAESLITKTRGSEERQVIEI